MKRLFLATALAASSWLAGCTSNGTVMVGGSTSSTGLTSGGSTTGSALSGDCASCFDNSGCLSNACVALGHADTYCLDSCDSSGNCSGGDTCQQLNDSAGNPVQVCVPASGACGDLSGGACPGGCAAGSSCDVASGSCVTPGTTSGSSGGTTTTGSSSTGTTGVACGSDVPPSTPAGCTCSSATPSNCTPNGCYGGYYCDTVHLQCVSAAVACGGSTASTGTTGTTTTTGTTGTTSTTGTASSTTGGTGLTTAGAPWSGSVNQSGGAVNRLYFAALGDCRPPTEDATTQYPTAIITKIFQDINALPVLPQFLVGTGDYMYADPSGSSGATQIQDFMTARALFNGVFFPAMGNHECTGATDSNCTTGATTHSNNFTAFTTTMLPPIGQTKPYYRYDINDTQGHWTAKFVVLAMNAWDTAGTQAAWLTTQLQDSTTYTFIIRHEPADGNTAPGVTPSEAIISQYPYTLKIVGHSHEFYYQQGSKEVVVGNAGAPLANPSDNYGYALIQQRADGNIQIDSYDYQSNTSLSSYLVSP